jgi:hypothetical protein
MRTKPGIGDMRDASGVRDRRQRACAPRSPAPAAARESRSRTRGSGPGVREHFGRRLALTLGGLALAAAVRAGQVPTPPAPASWYSARSAHFEVVSSAGPERASGLALQLERALAAASSLARADVAKLPPVTALELDSDAGFSYLRPLSGAPAFLHVAPERSFLVLDAGLREQALSAAQHALVHLLAASDPDPYRPLWLEEGTAELVSTARVREGALELGRPSRGRLEWFALATLHPLKRVLTARETLRWSEHARDGLAAESWALLHMLLRGDALGFPKRAAQLDAYLARVRAGAAPEAACSDAFGVTADALETELLRYLSFGQLPHPELPLATLGAFRVSPPSPVSPAERDALLGDLALSLGKAGWTPGEHWLRSASLRLSSAKAELAQLRALRGDDPAEIEPLLAEAEAAAPSDAATLRAAALARLALAASDVPPDPGQLAEAERLLGAARQREPGSITAQFAAAELARLRGDRAEAEAQLGDAQRRVPALGSLDVALARLALEANDSGEARAQLAHVLARPHEDMRGTSAEELEALLRRAHVDGGGPIATRHLTAHLEVSVPPAVRGVDSVELRGRGGRWEAAYHDVLLAIDESESTLVATGRDIDGNGRVGRNRTWERHVPTIEGLVHFQASGDPGDAVVSAEVAAARRLIAQLDPETMRVGLVSFAGTAWVDAPLGGPAAVMRQLDVYTAGYHDDGTSIASALRAAFGELSAHRDPEHARHRAILLLSDGQPTFPTREEGIAEALEAADRLATFGVPVHTFALGPQALEQLALYREIAARTGGRFVPVEHPGDVVSLLRSVRLTGLDRVQIRNETANASARSFQLEPDGSFRATLPLVRGVNQIEVTAEIEGREPLVVRRQVQVFEGAPSLDALAPEQPAPPTRAEKERAERELRERRTLHIEVKDDASAAEGRDPASE